VRTADSAGDASAGRHMEAGRRVLREATHHEVRHLRAAEQTLLQSACKCSASEQILRCRTWQGVAQEYAPSAFSFSDSSMELTARCTQSAILLFCFQGMRFCVE